jgi:ABC-type phosphate transport system ATPase subunit
MPTIRDQINNVYEQMIYLCEVRGELDPESNAKIEAKLKELQDELQVLQYEQDMAVIDFSCDL